MGKKRTLTDESKWGYILIAPTIIGLIVLNVYPFIQTLILSFSATHPFGIYEITGPQNYVRMFESREFWKATWNSIYFCILTVPAGLFLSLITAVLLNCQAKGQDRFPGPSTFFPWWWLRRPSPMVWKWIFNAEYGIINQMIGTKVNWLTNPSLVLPACAVVAIWSAIGYDAILLLSGIQNISKSYYEAASLDGATKIQQFFRITLPMVSPTLFVVLIMRLMASLKVYDLIYMMVDQTNPALTNAQSLMYLFYRESFVAGNRGYASAIVVWTVLLIGIVTALQFWGQKKWVNYEV